MIYPSVEYINQTRIDRAKLSFGDAAFKSLWLQIKLQRGFHSRLNGFQVRKKGILGERFAYSLDFIHNLLCWKFLVIFYSSPSSMTMYVDAQRDSVSVSTVVNGGRTILNGGSLPPFIILHTPQQYRGVHRAGVAVVSYFTNLGAELYY